MEHQWKMDKFQKLFSIPKKEKNGQKVNFQFSYGAGNNNGTSVEDGQIPEIVFHT